MSNFLEELSIKNPAKLEELSVLHWFTRAIKLEWKNLKCQERPDFTLEIEDQLIGIEITMAQRTIPNTNFSAKQIEQAQKEFAENLFEQIKPKKPVEIGLIFNDEIAVNNTITSGALKIIAPEIERISENMKYHSVEHLVRTSDSKKFGDSSRTHICDVLPSFLQHIQIFNDGHQSTCITGCRGGFVENFNDQDLLPILEKKHKALKGYSTCDEHWLVIYCGTVPPIIFSDTAPNILMSSMASQFASIEVTHPIETKFNKVFFFQCPTHAHQLTI